MSIELSNPDLNQDTLGITLAYFIHKRVFIFFY